MVRSIHSATMIGGLGCTAAERRAATAADARSIAWKWQAAIHGGLPKPLERRLAAIEAGFLRSGTVAVPGSDGAAAVVVLGIGALAPRAEDPGLAAASALDERPDADEQFDYE